MISTKSCTPTLSTELGRQVIGASAVNKKRTLWASCSIVILLAFNNLAFAPLESWASQSSLSIVSWAGCLGVMISQVPLHAIWCVFAPVRFGKRLAIAIAGGFVLFCSAAAGFAFVADNDEWGLVALVILFSLPLLAIAVQSPLWMAKYLLRWRVVFSSHSIDETPTPGFSIRDMLVATSILAMALSAAMLAAPFASPQQSSTTFLLEFAVESLIVGLVSAVTTGPVLAATLRVRRLGSALLILLLLDAAMTTASIIVLLATVPDFATAGWQAGMAVATIWGGFFGCLTASMLVARRLGLRLIWGRESKLLVATPECVVRSGEQESGTRSMNETD